MVAFDAPDRASCVVRRPRTNTPLQALTLLNDPVYVEAALALARRIHDEGGKTTSERITFAFRICLARPPSEREIELLTKAFEQSLARYQAKPASAQALIQNAASVRRKPGEELDAVHWAALYQVATLLLNLDEAITKN
jgi:hypothetical protein